MSEMERYWNDAETILCHVCGQTFSSVETMLMHLTRAHGDHVASDVPRGFTGLGIRFHELPQ